MGFGSSSFETTANKIVTLPPRTYALLLRSPATNTDDIYVDLGGVTANTGNLKIRPNETISINLSIKILALTLKNELTENDFIKAIAIYSLTANQKLLIDALTW